MTAVAGACGWWAGMHTSCTQERGKAGMASPAIRRRNQVGWEIGFAHHTGVLPAVAGTADSRRWHNSMIHQPG